MTKRATRRRPRPSTRSKTTRRRMTRAIKINRAQVSWLGGMLLLAIALVTLLSLLAVNRGAATEWWIGVLAQALGWGRYAVPIMLALLGLWLMTRLTDTPLRMPWIRLFGVFLLLITFLGFSHHLFSDREAAVTSGSGGGLLGYYLSLGLEAALGWAGAVVVFAMLLAIGMMVALDLSLDDIVRDLVAGRQRVREWLAVRRQRQAARSALAQQEASARPTPRDEALLRHEAAPIMNAPPRPSPQRPASPETLDDEEALPESLSSGARRWALPPVEALLAQDDDPPTSLQDMRAKARIIEDTLRSLGVPVTVVEVNPGPVVTQFGLEPGYTERRDRKGNVRRIQGQGQPHRRPGQRPGAGAGRRADPHRDAGAGQGGGGPGGAQPEAIVGLRGVIESDEFRELASPLALGLGRDVSGGPVVDDLTSLPHLLIAGATGSGKSVCINALVACLLCHNSARRSASCSWWTPNGWSYPAITASRT
jgi:DNA segregation ATPase FtsK/SpoIIIE, S-DNA-T family